MSEVRPVVKAQLRRCAEECVAAMGDVFWNFESERDGPLGFQEPRRVAVESVCASLADVAAQLDPFPTYSTDLEWEYRGIVKRIMAADRSAASTTLRRALVDGAEWTPEGAATIVRLAREHGVFVLRNALALAAALGIEDGEGGL